MLTGVAVGRGGAEGAGVGSFERKYVGDTVLSGITGLAVGARVGSEVGQGVGSWVSCKVGHGVGKAVGADVGCKVSKCVGVEVRGGGLKVGGGVG
mmetsp:Transcript_29594/g.43753  ORF Transcript_29594/g.43753 Transcript_29594/m.43753 type:complete len:95 (+) Transcript_29594:324-608(+)